MSNRGNTHVLVAIIAGTGFESAFDGEGRRVKIITPYGEVAATIVKLGRGEIAFLPRHGPNHQIAPHRINYRAHVWALSQIGAQVILATSAVGSLRRDRLPGDMIVLDDFIDFRGEATTFFDGADGVVRHVDFSRPFGERARAALIEAASTQFQKESSNSTVYNSGTYLCVSGPRYETPAEVRLFGSFGADVVGMTVAPEAILSRELGLEYAAVSVVTNLGTGLSDVPLQHDDVSRQMEMSRKVLTELFLKAAEGLLEEPGIDRHN